MARLLEEEDGSTERLLLLLLPGSIDSLRLLGVPNLARRSRTLPSDTKVSFLAEGLVAVMDDFEVDASLLSSLVEEDMAAKAELAEPGFHRCATLLVKLDRGLVVLLPLRMPSLLCGCCCSDMMVDKCWKETEQEMMSTKETKFVVLV